MFVYVRVSITFQANIFQIQLSVRDSSQGGENNENNGEVKEKDSSMHEVQSRVASAKILFPLNWSP